MSHGTFSSLEGISGGCTAGSTQRPMISVKDRGRSSRGIDKYKQTGDTAPFGVALHKKCQCPPTCFSTSPAYEGEVWIPTAADFSC